MSTETKPATKTAADSDRVLTGTHFMVGDHACAEGALAAGLDFFAGYPITPSTEVAERLAHRMPRVGAKFVQMEDELASMAAIIGASCAGGRTLTATSGPGFSLMMENIGLAAMMEVPCVVVNVMRAGPSTGLPTAVGQADILQARWGSHGDYGIVAYSPSSPQECFDLTIKAFNMADRYRIPAFVLMDETVGHMTERVVIPPEEEIVRVPRKAPKMAPGEGRFLPYQADEDLVPPMAHAGEGYKVHFTGLTHDERGYPALNAASHDKLIRRLVDKITVNAKELTMQEEFELDDAETVVISFGVTARAAASATSMARKKGMKVGHLRLITIWPFPEARVRELTAAGVVKKFVVPEVNLGQVRREVERLTHLPAKGVCHAGGKVITPEEILEVIAQ